METKPEKIFVNGIVSKEVPTTAPDFILGKFSINTNELIAWLSNNRKLGDEGGWINCTIMRSKNTGKRYVEVDQWKPVKPLEEMPEVKVELPPSNDTGEAPIDTVPF